MRWKLSSLIISLAGLAILCFVITPDARVYKNCNASHAVGLLERKNAALSADDDPPGQSLFSSVFLKTVQNTCLCTRNNCGEMTPSENSVFIGDGAYNSIDGTVFFVDAPEYSDGVFQFDPATCSVIFGTYHSVNYGRSKRGIAFDIPWQDEHDWYDLAAGMAFDDDSGQLILVNMYLVYLDGRSETLELFNFDLENGLAPAGYCNLSRTKYAYGLAII